MVIKLDMAHEFDHVRHSSLFHVIEKYGFSLEFIELVVSYIKEPWITPLINGWPCSLFHSSMDL